MIKKFLDRLMRQDDYPIPAPFPGLKIWLGILCQIALWIGLGIAAYDAFLVAYQSPAIAFCIAVGMEGAFIFDAIQLANARTTTRRAGYVAVVLLALGIAGILNYIAVESGNSSALTALVADFPIQRLTASFGPLLGALTLAWGVGLAMEDYEKNLGKWEVGRAQYFEKIRQEKAQRDNQDREEEREQNYRLEKARIRAQSEAARQFAQAQAGGGVLSHENENKRKSHASREIDENLKREFREAAENLIAATPEGEKAPSYKGAWVKVYKQKTGKSPAQAYKDFALYHPATENAESALAE